MLKTFVRGREFRVSLFFIILIVVFTIGDIAVDLYGGVSLDHVMHEVLILIFSGVLIFFQLKSNIMKSQHLGLMQDELDKVNQEKEDFRLKVADHAKAYALAAQNQFDLWHLTASEREIAVLLIKGLSMKEIAALRNSQEATVRQQATAIYKKSNLENRQQLAAYFLEDIF